jgi:hypothetical protein
VAYDGQRNDLYGAMIKGFRARAIRVHLVSQILPGYDRDSSAYEIDPHDRHPNALANQFLANYVLTAIVSSETGVAASAK